MDVAEPVMNPEEALLKRSISLLQEPEVKDKIQEEAGEPDNTTFTQMVGKNDQRPFSWAHKNEP